MFFNTYFRFKHLLWVLVLNSTLGACKGGAFRPYIPARPHVPANRYGAAPARPHVPVNRYGATPARPYVPANRYGAAPARPHVPVNRYGATPARPYVPVNRYGATPARPYVPANRYGATPARPHVPINRYGATPVRPHVPANRHGAAPARFSGSVTNFIRGDQRMPFFWPSERLESSAWIDSCNKQLAALENVVVNHIPISENTTDRQSVSCVACGEQDDDQGTNEFIRLSCQSCGQDPLIYCSDCCFDRMRTADGLSCPNRDTCNRLLPYELVEKGIEKVFRSAWDGVLESERVWLAPQEQQRTIDDAIESGDRVRRQYLNRGIDFLHDHDTSLKVVTCPENGCPFQALVQEAHASVPCYFHPQTHICVQCARQWSADHQCPDEDALNSPEQCREVRSFPCPQCETPIQRSDSCMHMTCSRCNHHWCWYCVFHFYGLPEHQEKTQAYANYDDYVEQHRRVWHDGDLGVGYGLRDSYTRHCNLGDGCPCRTRDF